MECSYPRNISGEPGNKGSAIIAPPWPWREVEAPGKTATCGRSSPRVPRGTSASDGLVSFGGTGETRWARSGHRRTRWTRVFEIRALSADELNAAYGGTTLTLNGVTFAFGGGGFAVGVKGGNSVQMSGDGISWKIDGKYGGVDYAKPK